MFPICVIVVANEPAKGKFECMEIHCNLLVICKAGRILRERLLTVTISAVITGPVVFELVTSAGNREYWALRIHLEQTCEYELYVLSSIEVSNAKHRSENYIKDGPFLLRHLCVITDFTGRRDL